MTHDRLDFHGCYEPNSGNLYMIFVINRNEFFRPLKDIISRNLEYKTTNPHFSRIKQVRTPSNPHPTRLGSLPSSRQTARERVVRFVPSFQSFHLGGRCRACETDEGLTVRIFSFTKKFFAFNLMLEEPQTKPCWRLA